MSLPGKVVGVLVGDKVAGEPDMGIEHEHTTTSTAWTERVFRVIEGVVGERAPVGPRGLARAIGIDRSAVARILQKLASVSVLERTSDGYVPGPRLIALGRVLASTDPITDEVNEILGQLVERFDETCYVAMFNGREAVYTHEIQSSHPLRFVADLGMRVPLYVGAMGRAILAGLEPDRAMELLTSQPLVKITANTITDPRRLVGLAEQDRERGYTVSIEERVPGGAAVAAPYFDRTGRCQGSVVFSAPLSRLRMEAIDEIGSAVAEAARALSQRLARTGHEV